MGHPASDQHLKHLLLLTLLRLYNLIFSKLNRFEIFVFYNIAKHPFYQAGLAQERTFDFSEVFGFNILYICSQKSETLCLLYSTTLSKIY